MPNAADHPFSHPLDVAAGSDRPSVPGPAVGSGPSRRAFLVMVGGLVVAGCSSSQHVTDMPDPDWPAAPRSDPIRPLPSPPRGVPANRLPPTAPLPAGVIPRSAWAKGAPDYSDMERMPPITHVTIHHDALSPFTATDAASSQARLELIRSSHRGKHWADIGYHYIVDRAGRVYEGRPITWQGAHVKDHNEGNIGVLCMGNFEVQSPSELQVNALVVQVKLLRSRHGVPARNVVTHREWKGAQTLCPGVAMQRRVASLRSNKSWA